MSNPVTGYRLPNDGDGVEAFCKDCRCWYHETVTLPDGATGLKSAQCRRWPPTQHFKGSLIFLRTEPDEWCGEFRP